MLGARVVMRRDPGPEGAPLPARGEGVIIGVPAMFPDRAQPEIGAAGGGDPTMVRLPREVLWALLAAPVLIQPIVNAEFFSDPFAQTAREIAGNYLPAIAIVLVLVGLYRWVVRSVVRSVVRAVVRGGVRSPANAVARFGVDVACCAAGAALASLLVHPFHATGTPLIVYLQRNVGLTCLLVVPALLLQQGRARVDAAERKQREAHHAAARSQLEARTQPHFLFNVLNTIASFTRDDPALAELTIQRLSGILRYAHDSARRETVSLARDLEVVEDYLEIQKARFGARLAFELSVAPGVGELPIAPFLIHPLVENAVLHGVATRRQGATVRVSVTTLHAMLEVRVDDDGPGPGRSTHRGLGTSLGDLERRVALVYGDRASLETSENEAGGFCARLRLPLAARAT
jgi:hypothetical protein